MRFVYFKHLCTIIDALPAVHNIWCMWIAFISLGDSSSIDASNDISDTSTDQHNAELSPTLTSKKQEELELEIASLESQLNEAVIAENYDEAGILCIYEVL